MEAPRGKFPRQAAQAEPTEARATPCRRGILEAGIQAEGR
jgi:hypothetical protein